MQQLGIGAPSPLVDMGSAPVEEAALVLMEVSAGGSPAGGAGGWGASESLSSSSSSASSTRVSAAAPDGHDAASMPFLCDMKSACEAFAVTSVLMHRPPKQWYISVCTWQAACQEALRKVHLMPAFAAVMCGDAQYP